MVNMASDLLQPGNASGICLIPWKMFKRPANQMFWNFILFWQWGIACCVWCCLNLKQNGRFLSHLDFPIRMFNGTSHICGRYSFLFLWQMKTLWNEWNGRCHVKLHCKHMSNLIWLYTFSGNIKRAALGMFREKYFWQEKKGFVWNWVLT